MGIRRRTFDDDAESLHRLFPKATIVEDAGGLRELVEGALSAIDHPLAARELPADAAQIVPIAAASRRPASRSIVVGTPAP